MRSKQTAGSKSFGISVCIRINVDQLVHCLSNLFVRYLCLILYPIYQSYGCIVCVNTIFSCAKYLYMGILDIFNDANYCTLG